MQVPSDVLASLSDLTRLATAGLFAVTLYFVRGALQELRDLRHGVYGPKGINERLARLEGAKESDE